MFAMRYVRSVACLLLPVVLALVGSSASAKPSGLSCQGIPARMAYETAWDEVLSAKRMALADGIRELQAIRTQMERDRADTIGAPGSAREAGIAIAIVVRETTDLTLRMGSLFKPGLSPDERRRLKLVLKTKKVADTAVEDTDRAIDDRAKDLADRLPTFIPGVQAARDIRDWAEAKSEVSRQITRIEATISKLEAKLTELGGRERAYSIDNILEMARARSQQCENQAADATPQSKAPAPRTLQPSQTPSQRPVTSGGAAPIRGACAITGTC